MSTPTIADQVGTFNEGFTAQIGPELSDVFAQEQALLTEAGVPRGAVAEGDIVPEARLVRADGSPTTLTAALGGRPAVLVFYRGAWCPYCNIALQTYQHHLLPELRARGVELLAISPQTPEGSERATQNGGLEFPVLSDPSNALIGRLGIRTEPTSEARDAHGKLGFDVADSNADATGDIPFPTVLVLNADRVVRFADVHVDYTTRTEVSDILDAVERL